MSQIMVPVSLITVETLRDVGIALCARNRFTADPKWSNLTDDAAVLGDCLLLATRNKWPVYPKTPQAIGGSSLAHWFLKLCPSERPYRVGFYENESYIIWPTATGPLNLGDARSYTVPKEQEYCCGVLYILNRYEALPPCLAPQ